MRLTLPSTLPLAASLLLCSIVPAAAQSSMRAVKAEVFDPGPIERLKPGEFLWAPQIAPQGPVTIIVSLAVQRAYVYRNGVPIGVSTISSGKPGHPTPTGIFTILQKDADHRSSLYDDAPMPFMQRLTWDGIALHGGTLPGYPASHGCVRLPLAFAKSLFAITRTGLTVVVTDDPLMPEVAPVGAPLQAPEADGHSAPREWHWSPDKATSGPVSIVISGRDRRLLVLRNGIEIGAAQIKLDEPITRTRAFTLATIDEDGEHWLNLPLPGAGPEAERELTAGDRTKAHLPDAFVELVRSVLVPGTTMLVTRESLASSGTREPVVVLDAVP